MLLHSTVHTGGTTGEGDADVENKSKFEKNLFLKHLLLRYYMGYVLRKTVGNQQTTWEEIRYIPAVLLNLEHSLLCKQYFRRGR